MDETITEMLAAVNENTAQVYYNCLTKALPSLINQMNGGEGDDRREAGRTGFRQAVAVIARAMELGAE